MNPLTEMMQYSLLSLVVAIVTLIGTVPFMMAAFDTVVQRLTEKRTPMLVIARPLLPGRIVVQRHHQQRQRSKRKASK